MNINPNVIISSEVFGQLIKSLMIAENNQLFPFIINSIKDKERLIHKVEFYKFEILNVTPIKNHQNEQLIVFTYTIRLTDHKELKIVPLGTIAFTAEIIKEHFR